MPTDNIGKLHSLNTLFALATGSERELADQIQSAINFSVHQGLDSDPSHDALTSSAERLLELHLKDRVSCSFEHCDFRADEDDPIFIRTKTLQALRLLSGYREAILLISGLKRLSCPPGKRWTEKRKERYRNLVDVVESLAAKHTSPKTNLRIIFL